MLVGGAPDAVVVEAFIGWFLCGVDVSAVYDCFGGDDLL